MPSMKNILGATAALVGMATAIPQGGPIINATLGYNSTTGPVLGNSTIGPGLGYNSTTANTTANGDDGFFCPRLDLQVYIDQDSVSYLVECDTTHFGVIIDITFNSTLLRKRQATAAPTNLGDCMILCDATATCVGTAFNIAAETCTLFSDVGAGYADVGTDFAVKVSGAAPTSATAGQTLTSTLYATTVITVSSCAPTVTDCPLKSGANAVITEVIPLTSTDYICPSATVLPVAPVACGCAYSASTVSAYSASVGPSGTVLVPVYSTVVAIPAPSATTYSTTTVPASVAIQSAAVSAGALFGGATVTVCPGCPTAAAAATATATAVPTGPGFGTTVTASSGLATYPGAAGQIKAAGAGMGALVAAAALFL